MLMAIASSVLFGVPVVSLVAGIISVLMVASRFLESSKPLWDKLPKAVQVVLPAIVVLIPQVISIVTPAVTVVDLVQNLIAAVALVVVGLSKKG